MIIFLISFQLKCLLHEETRKSELIFASPIPNRAIVFGEEGIKPA